MFGFIKKYFKKTEIRKEQAETQKEMNAEIQNLESDKNVP